MSNAGLAWLGVAGRGQARQARLARRGWAGRGAAGHSTNRDRRAGYK